MQIIGRLADMEARAEMRPQTEGQLRRFDAVLKDHPEAIAVTCGDEKTGVRFGNAKRRAGMCVKIGGARQPRWYQAWATWAPADLAEARKENA